MTSVFYVVLSVGGIFAAGFMAVQLYGTLRDGLIERRPGLKPVSPQSGAVLYWFAVSITAVGMTIILFGVAEMISNVLSAS